MTLRTATITLVLYLAPCLLLTDLISAARAGVCHHCPKTVFVRPKPPCIKYKCVCPKPIDCCGLEHFGYYPTCWSAWPGPPNYSHCPCPPVLPAAPRTSGGTSTPLEQLPTPRTTTESKQSSLE
jgi:hypothetical protein